MAAAFTPARAVDAMSLSTITSMINPRVFQTLASGTLLCALASLPKLYILLIACSSCRGSCLWGSFVSGVVAYKTLPRQVCLSALSSYDLAALLIVPSFSNLATFRARSFLRVLCFARDCQTKWWRKADPFALMQILHHQQLHLCSHAG